MSKSELSWLGIFVLGIIVAAMVGTTKQLAPPPPLPSPPPSLAPQLIPEQIEAEARMKLLESLTAGPVVNPSAEEREALARRLQGNQRNN